MIKHKLEMPHPLSKPHWRVMFENVQRAVDEGKIKAELPMVVYFTDGKVTRTPKQNRYYRGVVLAQFASEAGMEPDEVHQIWIRRFSTYEVKQFGPNKCRIYKTTSAMTKEEMARFIDRCIIFCAEAGVTIPDPEALTDEQNVALHAEGIFK